MGCELGNMMGAGLSTTQSQLGPRDLIVLGAGGRVSGSGVPR